MEFGLLGPLLVQSGEILVPVPAARQRVLLAALLLGVNQVVSLDELVDTLWQGRPPPTARVTVQNYVKRLRGVLGDTGHSRIATRSGGYLIRAGAEELDITRFGALQGQARDAARRGEWSLASARLHAALALWRGRPLADVPCDRLAVREVPRLGEMRLRAVEACVDADLHLGLHGEVVGELRQLVALHPLRERLHAQLMHALYLTGRQGDALAAYQEARHVLIEELGVEPGPELRRLHQQILTADPGLDVAAGSGDGRLVGTAMTLVPPRQLPAAPAHFAGRQRELRVLNEWLDAGAGAGEALISVITGTAGVGKTALAMHWAHQVRQQFPDGQLYVNLRGFDPSGNPMAPTEAIREFLDSLGMPADRIPSQLDAQAALYRSLQAGKRMLIVADNARDESQVRPLIPAARGALVLVTSRSKLAGLAAAEGARVLTLDVLAEAEARELVASRLGAERTASEPEAATEVIGHCARLPLALSILAARAATTPGSTLAAMAAELRDARSRLDALDAGDPSSSVRAVLSWSCRQLSRGAARMFRLLGIHPGPDITADAAASLAAVSPGHARRLLRELARAHLLTEHAPGRFAFHDLLRAYAAEQAGTRESTPGRRAATARILGHYQHTAHAAAALLGPDRDPAILAPPAAGVAPENLTSRSEAMAWFTAEYKVLIKAITLAADHGFYVHAWQIPAAMREFFARRGHWDDWAATSQIALTAARRLGDQAAQALARRNLGDALIQLGQCEEALAHLRQALNLCRRLGDQAGQGCCHVSIARIFEQHGDYSQALRHARQALRLYRAHGERALEAYALNAAGWFHAQLGNQQLARAYCQEALGLHREHGNRFGEAATLDSLAYCSHQAGHHGHAVALYQQALAASSDAGDRYYHAGILSHLGESHHANGNHQAARHAWQQALAILDDLRHPEAGVVRARLAGFP